MFKTRKALSRAKRTPKELNLTRDLDGYVHTADGFLAPVDYEQLRADNPQAGLPSIHEIPLMEMPDTAPPPH